MTLERLLLLVSEICIIALTIMYFGFLVDWWH
jgi:hypothetical protein